MELIKQPNGEVRLGDWLKLNFQNRAWGKFSAAVAFVKASGVRHVAEDIRSFIQRGGSAKFVIGIDWKGTSSEGLRMLLDCLESRGEIWIAHNENPSTFHPKIYLFEGETSGSVFVGSGNLTEGGLYTNYEGGIILNLNLQNPSERRLYQAIHDAITEWADSENGLALRLNEELLNELIRRDLTPTEVRTRESGEERETTEMEEREVETGLFRRLRVKSAPVIIRMRPQSERQRTRRVVLPPEIPAEGNQSFLMTLQRTDAGVGQTTAGTARRSPEIFVPLAARNANPEFWGWPDLFVGDPSRPGKYDRTGVRMRLGGDIFEVNMMTWPVKHDFRLRSEALRSAGNIGDILRVEKVDESTGFSYYVEIIPHNTSQYRYFLALCQNHTRNSQKRWGYT